MKLRHSVVFVLSLALLFMLSVLVWKLDEKTTDRWYGRNGLENRTHIKDLEQYLKESDGYTPPVWADEL